MKRILLLSLVLVLTAFTAPVLSWADDGNKDDIQKSQVPISSATAVDGGASIGLSREHGNDQVGGFGDALASGDFSAQGEFKASGKADATGSSTGAADVSDPNTVKSFSKSDAGATFDAKGNKTTGDLHVETDQGNWATFHGTDGNSASAGNTTNALADAKVASDHGKTSGSGTTLSDGSSQVSVKDTENLAQSTAMTTGKSNAGVHLDGRGQETTFVSGFGGISAQSLLDGGPSGNFLAGAAIYGDGNFQGSGGRAMNGSLLITGSTTSMVAPDKVSASATVQSTAQTGSGIKADSNGGDQGKKH